MNQVRSLARRLLGWNPTDEEESRAAINKRAATLIDEIWASKAPPAGGWKARIWVYGQSADLHQKDRKLVEKVMAREVQKLPISAWAAGVRGLGAMSLASIIGEAGDVGSYDNPAKLWKRFGLAPKTEYKMTTKEGKEAFCIPRRRRSIMWVVGDVLIKCNRGPYRQLYDERKAYEADRNPEMSKMHCHRRAQRYMEKRLLRDLWVAWKRGGSAESAAMPL